jgi:hypothetical protein
MTLRLADLEVTEDLDENEALVEPAQRIRRREIPLHIDEGIFGVAWSKLKHPRWPKGTKNWKGENIGGQFMRVGERFKLMGTLPKGGNAGPFEIAHVVGGKVWAHNASGQYSGVKTLELTKKKTTGGLTIAEKVEVLQPKVTSGGKTGGYGGYGEGDSPIVDPYVYPETHDPKLKLPENSKLTAEEWETFGKVDQENYIALMERYGAWKPNTAGALFAAAYKEYSAHVQQIVSSAYSSQYGSSSGQEFSMPNQTPENYVEAKMLLNDLGAALQWDLYNRTRAPDVALFHKGGQGVEAYNSKYIHGNTAIYSGYSQSFKFAVNDSFGSYTVATPTAIRHIVQWRCSAGCGDRECEQR